MPTPWDTVDSGAGASLETLRSSLKWARSGGLSPPPSPPRPLACFSVSRLVDVSGARISQSVCLSVSLQSRPGSMLTTHAWARRLHAGLCCARTRNWWLIASPAAMLATARQVRASTPAWTAMPNRPLESCTSQPHRMWEGDLGGWRGMHGGHRHGRDASRIFTSSRPCPLARSRRLFATLRSMIRTTRQVQKWP